MQVLIQYDDLQKSKRLNEMANIGPFWKLSRKAKGEEALL